MNEPQFKKEDVWAVARAIGSGLYTDDRGKNAYIICGHCRASTYMDWQDEEGSYREFKHDPNCVVLIAQDLLVGSTKEAS
jgi:hypothetical protein